MPTLRHLDRELAPAAGESVLDCLLRAGVAVPSSCRAGACQSCLVRAVDGEPPAAAQQGLKETLRARGYFLSCVAHPTTALTVALSADEELRCPARVHSTARLTPQILCLRLLPEAAFPYAAGQFINLLRPDGLVRSYSLASLPGRDPYLELHIRLHPGGQMGGYVETLRPGDPVSLRGPSGECFYVEGRPEQPILLAGTGTGLAPLYGILKDALQRGHHGPLVLLHGAATAAGLYLQAELRALAAAHRNVQYLPCALQPAEAATDELHIGALDALLGARHPTLRGWRAFLCGDPALVNKLRRQVFLAGASRKDIASDAFLSAPPAPPASPASPM
jgi:NAD(P)H-flavin reductase